MPNNKARGLKMENENLDNLDLNNADHGDDAKQENAENNKLHEALRKERKMRGEYEKQAKAWSQIDKTPDEINQILQEREAAERKKDEEAGNFDKIREQIVATHNKELEALRQENNELMSSYKEEIITSRARQAIAAANGSAPLLLPTIEKLVKAERVDGKWTAIVVDEKGEPRFNGKGENLTIAELIEEMKQSNDYARAFDGSGQSGSGMQPNKMSGGATLKRSQMTAEQKADYQQKHGQAAFLQLPR